MQVDTTGFDQLQRTKSHSVANNTRMAGLVCRRQMWMARRPETSKSLSSLISTSLALERLLQKNEFRCFLFFCVIHARLYDIVSLFIDPFILNYSKTPFNPTQSNTHVKRCVGNLLKLSYLQVVSPPSIAEQCKEIANQVEIRADTIRMLSKPLDLILPYTSHHPLARFRPPSSSSLRIAFDRAKSEMFPWTVCQGRVLLSASLVEESPHKHPTVSRRL